MQNWKFSYQPFEPTSGYRDQTYTDVWTVEQFRDSTNYPITDINNYGFRSLSIEKYAKNIGQVFRQFELWEYQPNPSGASPYKTGFGVTLWMIDHN